MQFKSEGVYHEKVTPKKHKGFGINVDLNNAKQNSIDTYIDALKELRVEWVRLQFDFLGSIDISTNHYFLNKCRKNGINVLGLLVNHIPGKLSNLMFPWLNYKPIYEERSKFYDFVRKIVYAFNRSINHWQILNEVNTVRFWIKTPDPKEYMEMYAKTRRLIKSLDKRHNIVFGSVLGDDSNIYFWNQKKNFISDSMKIKNKDHIEAASFHPYFMDCYISFNRTFHYLRIFKSHMDKIIGIKRKYKLPVWITEFGICSRWVRLQPNDIAQVYFQAYRMCASHDIPFFLWQLNDTKTKTYLPGYPERYFGLLTEDLRPKKLYNELVTVFNG